jgi:hypothetical protein
MVEGLSRGVCSPSLTYGERFQDRVATHLLAGLDLRGGDMVPP